MMATALRLCLGLAVAALFVTLLVRQMPVAEAARAAGRVGAGTLAAGGALIVAAYLVRTLRWQLMLRQAGIDLAFAPAARLFFAAFALNNVLPLRAGDVYRWVAAPAGGGRLSGSFAVLAVERALDLAALAAAFLVLLLAAGLPEFGLPRIALALPAAAVLLAVALLFAAPGPIGRALRGDRTRRLREGVAGKVLDQIAAAAEAAERILRGGIALRLLALTLAGWGLEFLVFVTAAFAFHGPAGAVGGVAGAVLGTLATLLPGAPGHVGTFDYFATRGFEAGGLAPAAAVAAALVAHVVVVVPVTLIGAIGLLASARPRSRAC